MKKTNGEIPEYHRQNPVIAVRVPLALKGRIEALARAENRTLSNFIDTYAMAMIEELVTERESGRRLPILDRSRIRRNRTRKQG